MFALTKYFSNCGYGLSMKNVGTIDLRLALLCQKFGCEHSCPKQAQYITCEHSIIKLRNMILSEFYYRLAKDYFVHAKALMHNFMVTPSNGNIFLVIGLWCGEFTGHRWIPFTKASEAELWWFLWLRVNKRVCKQSGRRWSDTPSRWLWPYCNVCMKAQLVIPNRLVYFCV